MHEVRNSEYYYDENDGGAEYWLEEVESCVSLRLRINALQFLAGDCTCWAAGWCKF